MSDVSNTTKILSERKRHKRAEIRAARNALPTPVRQQRDTQIQAHLSKELANTHARTVAAYFPMKNEPGGAQLVDTLRALDLQVILPRVVDDPVARGAGASGTLAQRLEWAVENGDITTSSLGIEEPTGHIFHNFPGGIDLFIVPALAIDHSGKRLGQGGGFYDRALAQLGSDTELWAIVDHSEFMPEVPADELDLRVTAVVTECGLIKIRR